MSPEERIDQLEGWLRSPEFISLVADRLYERQLSGIGGRRVRDANRPTIQKVKEVVAGYYGIPVADLEGQSRIAEHVNPRKVAYFMARLATGRSWATIGREFDRRDHTTALMGARSIEDALWAGDDELARAVEGIERLLGMTSQAGERVASSPSDNAGERP